MLEEDGTLFSGDNILGEGRSVVCEDVATYIRSLQLMSSLRPTTIYPGHGPIVEDPVQRVSDIFLDFLCAKRITIVFAFG